MNKIKRAKTMEDLLEEDFSVPASLRAGSVVEGKVVSITHGEVVVDVGGKSEGIVSGDDLSDESGTCKNLKVGDKVLVTVAQTEDSRGSLVLSFKKAEKERRWAKLQQNFSQGIPFEVGVMEYNKGGILVDVEGLRGFVPISHLNKTHFAQFNKATTAEGPSSANRNLKEVLGETLKVKIIELDKEQNRIVLSEKELESAKIEKEIRERLKKIKVGDVLEGAVIAILPFGLLVDCGGIDGLIHISEVSWEKVQNLSGLYRVGDKVKVKVLTIDEKEGKLGLSVKALMDNPWDKLAGRYQEGAIVKGKVTKIMPFGAFVELEPGLEGLVHVSETVGPLNPGDAVKAMVITIDPQNQKLALSMRKIEESKIYK